MAPTPYVALHPATGLAAGLADDLPVVEIGPRRWGRRVLGEEQVCLTTPWAGYRWGPVPPARRRPAGAAADHAASTPGPRPRGRSAWSASTAPRGSAAGIEFADIRPFRAGDRLRRISWRVSVAQPRAARHHLAGRGGQRGPPRRRRARRPRPAPEGLDGAPSSLDQSVRAAAAVAEHHIRAGDRVGLRVVGGDGGLLGYGAGTRHLRALLDLLAGVRPGELPEGIAHAAAAAGDRRQRGLRVLADARRRRSSPRPPAWSSAACPWSSSTPCPPDASPRVPDGVDPRVAELAWRMRRLERDQVLAGLAASAAR